MKNKMKILITGGTGMIGAAFKNVVTSHNLILVGSQDYDLTNENSTREMFQMHTPDAVIHLAARVGGVKGNSDYVADFYEDNIRINTNVLRTARFAGVKKLVALLSTCIYPDKAVYPLTPNQIHNGPPHESNFGYAYAKRMLDVQIRAYRHQYGLEWITAVPGNAYGPNDNFDLEASHVVPAIIRKIWEAKKGGDIPVFWGDGSPLREFTYSLDLAQILLFLLENYNASQPINIGDTVEYTIKDIVQKVALMLEYKGTIKWDSSKPMGQYRKPSNNDPLLQLGWKKLNYTSVDEGLQKTCEWFVSSYPNVRGIQC